MSTNTKNDEKEFLLERRITDFVGTLHDDQLDVLTKIVAGEKEHKNLRDVAEKSLFKLTKELL